MSGEATYLGVPPLSPVYDGSKAIVRNPLSAISCAYRPDTCSFTAPNGSLTAIAGNFPLTLFGTYRSAASVIPYRLTKVTLLWLTLSLLGNVLSHSVVRISFSALIMLSLSFIVVGSFADTFAVMNEASIIVRIALFIGLSCLFLLPVSLLPLFRG